MANKPTIIRKVYAENLSIEMNVIQQILPYYHCIAMDTEFPGTIFNLGNPSCEKICYSKLSPTKKYKLMKANVDVTNLIQIGLTFTNGFGELPDLGTDYTYIWEFNFCDFDVDRDLQNLKSIELLKNQGMDFQRNKYNGIDSSIFGVLLGAIGLVNCNLPDSFTWITFHGTSDFGYLIKLLIQEELPDEIEEFLGLVRFYFGAKVFDVKHMVKFCDGIYGGLDKVANSLEIGRSDGKIHQAASDSLLTNQTFFKVLADFFPDCRLDRFWGNLYGFEI